MKETSEKLALKNREGILSGNAIEFFNVIN